MSFFRVHFSRPRLFVHVFAMSNEEEEPSAPTDQETRFSSLEAKLDALSSSFEALAHKFDARSSARPTVSQNSGTFFKYYKKDVTPCNLFASAVLDNL